MRTLFGMIGLALVAFGVAVALTRFLEAPPAAPNGTVWIPGGEFTMGTNASIGWKEKPTHRFKVEGFWMDQTEVTNAQFAKFVHETGHVTTAEMPPELEEIMRQSPPGTKPPAKEKLVPGSLVFQQTLGLVKTGQK